MIWIILALYILGGMNMILLAKEWDRLFGWRPAACFVFWPLVTFSAMVAMFFDLPEN